MVKWIAILAQAAGTEMPPQPGRPGHLSPIFYDVITVLGGVFFVSLLLILWAAYVRRPRRRSEESRREPLKSPTLVKKVVEEDGRRRVKIKERRRDHRGRNPTLAETGGLPPPKDDSPRE